MNVLFVNPKTEGYSRSVTTPLGLLSIASFLETNGFGVRLYDRTVEKVPLEKVLADVSPDMAGISLVSYLSIKDALAVSEQIKALGIPVIWGGPLASELPEAVLKNGCVDAVSLGEGEVTWLELADSVKDGRSGFGHIAGLALRGPDGACVRTPEREFIDLGELPDVDWSLVNVERYFQSSYGCKKMLYLYSAKGCPHNCAFCYNKDFHRCTYRKRPMDAVLREIRYLVQRHGMDGVYFADELWCRNVKEMHETCDSLRSLGLDFVWGGQTRIGLFKQEDFRYMYDAGCRWIFFGVESGSKRVLAEMNKHIAYDKIEQTFADCRKAGIVAIGSFIIGFPGETPEDAKETVDLINRLDTTLINLNYFIVVPGADIYYKLIEEGKYKPITDLKEVAERDPMKDLDYNYSSIPPLDIKVIQSRFMWRSFLSNNIKVDGKRNSFTKKVITDALKSVKNGTLKAFILSTWSAGTEFLRIFRYAHFYPGIRKKYGMK